MKIIIECTEVGCCSLIEAIQNKLNDCVNRYNTTTCGLMKSVFCSQEFSLHDILAQILEQLNEGKEKNDG